ncbi:MAG: hypothetical protein ACE5FY_00545 [Nitrospiria bacterium]
MTRTSKCSVNALETLGIQKRSPFTESTEGALHLTNRIQRPSPFNSGSGASDMAGL